MKQLFAMLSLCVCLAVVHAQRTALPSSCGDEKAIVSVAAHGHGSVPAPPEAGKAKAVFIERADKNAAPVVTRVALDGTWQGGNQGNSYFELTVAPGEHHVCVDWQLPHRLIKDAAAFDVFTAEAGKIYYFRVNVAWAQNVELPQYTRYNGDMTLGLSAVNADEGQYLVLNSKVSTSSVKK
jgi:hypothetical protein